MKKPNFFIVGAPRCGTSALYEYLRTHPDICMPDYKEPHYFSGWFSNHWIRVAPFDAYLDLFKKCGEDKILIGEASTTYILSADALKNIYKFDNKAKIIVMVRNPIEMVHSLHSRLVYRLQEDEKDFEKAWRLQASRGNGENIPKTCLVSELLQYSNIGKLGKHIENLFDIFPKEQIKIILFEDFKRNPKEVYENVLVFLNVHSDGKTVFPVFNENTVYRSFWFFYLFNKKFPFLDLPVRKFKKLIGVGNIGVRNLIYRLNSKKSPRAAIRQEFHAELVKEFSEDIDKLSRILNKDISHWKC